MTTEDERRNTDRKKHSSSVLHREYTLEANKSEYVKDELVDISPDGVAFVSSRQYDPGDLLEVRLLLYGWEKYKTSFYYGDPRKATDPLVALVEVASIKTHDSSQWRIGAGFTSIDEAHQKALVRYIERLKSDNL